VLGPLLFSLFINDITMEIKDCQYHLYADDVQLYISCPQSKYTDCISSANLDLNRIHEWSLRNKLLVNPRKSQAMLVNPACLQIDTSLSLHMGGTTIAFIRKVKNLGLVMNSDLTWDDQVSKVCRSVLFTLKRLWTMSQFTPLQTRHKLVTSLVIPQFLYCDVIFSKSTARLRERLKIAFNSCARYIYGISRYQHISAFSIQILGVPLEIYYSYRICCTMNSIIKSGCARYLFSELQFGQSSRRLNLITPVHRSSRSTSSFFVQGAMLWNSLPPEVKREGSNEKFREKCLSHLWRLGGSNGGM
jgi:Reverse transcriptase (RNA-dependent DNA polymerase)